MENMSEKTKRANWLQKGYRNKWLIFVIISVFLFGYAVGFSFGVSKGINETVRAGLFFLDVKVDNRVLTIVEKFPVLKKIMPPEDWEKLGLNNTNDLKNYQYEEIEKFINASLKQRGY